MLAPWIANAVFLLDRGARLDWTPFSFGITGAALAIGLMRTQSLLGVIRLTRAELTEERWDAVLVADKTRTGDLAKLVARLAATDRPDAKFDGTIERPWGRERILTSGPGFQVTEITLRPGGRRSAARAR